jgi:large subunit ribosomal protein L5
MKALTEDLAKITGQHAQVTKARVSISNFKLRQGMQVGARVTLRGDRMYEFLERLIQVALPRIRDFRGISTRSFDGRGNYTLGIKEQSIFPEIDPNDISVAQGMDITIVTTAHSDDEARKLLTFIGLPFAEK